MIASILVIPVDASLLADGVCGGRAPMMYKSTSKRTPGQWRPLVSTATMSTKVKALVIAYKGAPAPGGTHRLKRMLDASWDWSGGRNDVEFWVSRLFREDTGPWPLPAHERVRRCLGWLRNRLLGGTLILLDDNGKVIEVAP